MKTILQSISKIEPAGGDPVLDFINTVHSRYPTFSGDYLQSYDDVVQWHLGAKLVSNSTAKRLLDRVITNPQQAATGFKRAIVLRETLYRIFYEIAKQKSPSKVDIEELNEMLVKYRWQQRLQIKKRDVCWYWQIDTTQCEFLLGPIAVAAAELLTSGKLERIKECPAPNGCGWLFLDTSRNRSRHWCSMKTCGNVAKVRRFRKKQA